MTIIINHMQQQKVNTFFCSFGQHSLVADPNLKIQSSSHLNRLMSSKDWLNKILLKWNLLPQQLA